MQGKRNFTTSLQNNMGVQVSFPTYIDLICLLSKVTLQVFSFFFTFNSFKNLNIYNQAIIYCKGISIELEGMKIALTLAFLSLALAKPNDLPGGEYEHFTDTYVHSFISIFMPGPSAI